MGKGGWNEPGYIGARERLRERDPMDRYVMHGRRLLDEDNETRFDDQTHYRRRTESGADGGKPDAKAEEGKATESKGYGEDASASKQS